MKKKLNPFFTKRNSSRIKYFVNIWIELNKLKYKLELLTASSMENIYMENYIWEKVKGSSFHKHKY